MNGGSLHHLLLLRAGDHRHWADHRLGPRSTRWRRDVDFASSISSGIVTAYIAADTGAATELSQTCSSYTYTFVRIGAFSTRLLAWPAEMERDGNK